MTLQFQIEIISEYMFIHCIASQPLQHSYDILGALARSTDNQPLWHIFPFICQYADAYTTFVDAFDTNFMRLWYPFCF